MAGSVVEEAKETKQHAVAPAEGKPVPPPETPSSQRTRRWIVLCFWTIVVCLGLPHWLWTTSTYRASLPLDVMTDWAEGKTCQLHFPLVVGLSVPSWSKAADVRSLAEELQVTFGPQAGLHGLEMIAGHPGISHVPEERRKEALKVVLHADEGRNAHQHVSRLEPGEAVLTLDYGLARPGGRDGMVQWIADEIKHVFAAEQTSLAYLLSGTPFATEHTALIDSETKAKLDARSTRAFKYASTYHLTFSLFTPGASPSAWDIEAALAAYIHPLVNALSRISNLTITTQVQLHASFSPSIAGPQYNSGSKVWELQKSDLSGFVNAAEWPLSPSVGSGPTMNFVLYVPSPEQAPLAIAETGGVSWLVPQWGGVAILNPNANTASHAPTRLTQAELEPAMLTFADQLTSLIGLPSAPASLALRLESLTRERTTSLILSTASTLGALARLTLKLPNIAIPDSVASSVDTTLSRLDAACQDLRTGNYDSALANARTANDEAEKAFFEPSMVGQVYFPDEHKVAVYVPLLGPMAVPLLLAGVKELRRLREVRKVKAA